MLATGFHFLLHLLAVIYAKPSQAAVDQVISLASVSSYESNLIYSNLATTLSLNASAENLEIRCDGTKYGFNPNIIDCESAKEFVIPDDRQISFGERHTGKFYPAETHLIHLYQLDS